MFAASAAFTAWSCLSAACSRTIEPSTPRTEPGAALEVAADPPRGSWQRRVVASGLMNPRGMLDLADGSLLVAEAGIGDPERPLTGQIVRLVDANRDGDFDDPGERQPNLREQPSVNILRKLAVNRDEVFGLADLEAGDGMIVATLADPTLGSKLLRLDRAPAEVWATTRDNANSITWHERRRRWYAVQSFANTVIEIAPDGANRNVASIASLEGGQHAVPASIIVEPQSGALLVALFSGQLGGDTAGSGVDFVKRSGRIVRLDPETGAVTTAVKGLNAPTDIALHGDTLFVLEFCSDFRDPVKSVAEASSSVRHAGFERYSGRLLTIDLESGKTVAIVEQLDLPTHLRLLPDGRVLVTEGMGTPGRTIPGPSGPTPLVGRIVELRRP